MRLQQVLSYVRRAADDYHMIQEGDRIAVGISGGKDSLTLLYALHGLQRFYPQHFELHAVTVDLGFQNLDLSRIESICRDELQILIPSLRRILQTLFSSRGRRQIPALCARKCGGRAE